MSDGDRADLLIGQLKELFAEWDSVWDDYAEPELRDHFIADFEAVRREARAEEREGCARLCDHVREQQGIEDGACAEICAAAIRARGKQ